MKNIPVVFSHRGKELIFKPHKSIEQSRILKTNSIDYKEVKDERASLQGLDPRETLWLYPFSLHCWRQILIWGLIDEALVGNLPYEINASIEITLVYGRMLCVHYEVLVLHTK